MAGWTNESFIADIKKEFGKDFDWDSVPDPDTLPDIYVIEGIFKHQQHYYYHEPWKCFPEGDRLAVRRRVEFTSQEEALQKLAELLEDAKKNPDSYQALHLPSLKVSADKPEKAVDMWLNRLFVLDIRAGIEVFPMYFP